MLSSERREEFGDYLAEFDAALATLSRESCSQLKLRFVSPFVSVNALHWKYHPNAEKFRIWKEPEESPASSFFGTSKTGFAKHYAYNGSAISQAINSRFIPVTERVPSQFDDFSQADACRPAFAVCSVPKFPNVVSG